MVWAPLVVPGIRPHRLIEGRAGSPSSLRRATSARAPTRGAPTIGPRTSFPQRGTGCLPVTVSTRDRAWCAVPL